MILKNFLVINSSNSLTGNGQCGLQSSTAGKIYATSTGIPYSIQSFGNSATTTNTISTGYLYVLIGTGQTTATEDDVGLENIIMAKSSDDNSAALKMISSTSFASIINSDGRSYTRKVSTTYRNDNSQQSYIIREVGIGSANLSPSSNVYRNMATNEIINVTDNPHGCITRDVLDIPITMNYGDTYTFTVEITGLPVYTTPPTT